MRDSFRVRLFLLIENHFGLFYMCTISRPSSNICAYSHCVFHTIVWSCHYSLSFSIAWQLSMKTCNTQSEHEKRARFSFDCVLIQVKGHWLHFRYCHLVWLKIKHYQTIKTEASKLFESLREHRGQGTHKDSFLTRKYLPKWPRAYFDWCTFCSFL